MGPDLVPWLLYEPEDDGLLWIRFNRPERMNATVGAGQVRSTVAKVVEYMQAGDDDPNVSTIILTGVGRAFCGGNDFRGPRESEDPGEFLRGNRAPHEGVDGSRRSFFHGLTKVMREISLIRKPTVAMVNGPAAGSGMDMALHCDIRIGCENTRFIAYHQRGQIIENGGCYYLPRVVGIGRALEFAYRGSIDAEEAYRWGLLNHLTTSEELETFTRSLCHSFDDVPPLTKWINKRIMRAALDSSFEASMVMTSNASGILAASEDAREARQASIERRRPRFSGR